MKVVAVSAFTDKTKALPSKVDCERAAVSDRQLWELWYTAVPEPPQVGAYIATALEGQRAGHMLPLAVRGIESGKTIGSTRYHDILPNVDRVEIGYTW
jgi:hypothetical protein